MIVPSEKSQPELPPYDEASAREVTDSKTSRNILTSTYGGPFSPGSQYAPHRLEEFNPGSSTSSPPFSTSFSRPPPRDLPYPSFEPTFLVCRGKYLYKGFLQVPPPSSANPHPFITHDVNERDWQDFLVEIQEAASLTEKDVSRSHLPIVSIIPFVNCLAAYGIQKYMKCHKDASVLKVIDIWNHHFFRPRKVEVILTRGQAKLSGTQDYPIADLHSPETSSAYSSFSDKGKTKGKEKEITPVDQEQSTYRLFVVPI